METKAADIDGFIAVSDYYRNVMKKNMNIPEEKLYTVHIGVDPKDYSIVPVTGKKRNIGFISRMCYDNGLDILTDAFIELRKLKEYDDVNLVITGGATGDDSRYIKNIRKKLMKNGLSGAVEFHEEFEGEGRKDFFTKVSVVSVPVRNGEAFGIYLLESMASGVPVVQPALGAFPEIISRAGGGLLYEPNSAAHLSKTLAGVLSSPELLKKLSLEGRQGVEDHFDIAKHSDEMIDVYTIISNKKKP
jgi:glycosyltransferase involved in cell wall biosynthesis